MLLALNDEKQVVLAEEVTTGAFLCPSCLEKVILKRGQIMIPHFAHGKHSQCLAQFSEGETAEHLRGKKLLCEILPDDAQMEAFLPELQQRPDVLWQRQAFEFQCSTLNGERFRERTENYLAHSYRPFWILGKKLSPERTWGALQQGASFFKKGQLQIWVLNVKQESFEIFSNFYWHYQKGVNFSKTSFPLSWLFSAGPLPETKSMNPWEITDLKQTIQIGLGLRQKRLLTIQEQLYLRKMHLLSLPEWCYLPSRFFVFYQFQLLNLRSLFLVCDSFDSWQVAVGKLAIPWTFLQVPQEKVLRGIFNECQRLTGKKVATLTAVT